MKILPDDFNIDEYLILNEDVKNSGINHIDHNLIYGINEGRLYKTKDNSVGLALIAKNEAPYILEWIAYHIALGVDKIIIADNNSHDGTKELLVKLHEKGVITLLHYYGQKNRGPQLPAYTEILRVASDIDWLAFIDTDEFIFIDSDISFKKIINRISIDETIGAIALNWAIFGSSYHENAREELVIERFTKRGYQSFFPNHHIKSIVRMSSVFSVGPNAHKFKLKDNYRYVYSNKQTLIDHEIHGIGLSDSVVWQPLRLNHYVVKSKSEFFVRAKERNVFSSEINHKDINYFNGHDRNDEYDPIDHEFLIAVKEKINELKNIIASQVFKNDSNIQLINDVGCIDEVYKEGNFVRIKGWAFLFSSSADELSTVSINNILLNIISIRACKRDDVLIAKENVNNYCGFEIVCDLMNMADDNLKIVDVVELIFSYKNHCEVLKKENFSLV